MQTIVTSANRWFSQEEAATLKTISERMGAVSYLCSLYNYNRVLTSSNDCTSPDQKSLQDTIWAINNHLIGQGHHIPTDLSSFLGKLDLQKNFNNVKYFPALVSAEAKQIASNIAVFLQGQCIPIMRSYLTMTGYRIINNKTTVKRFLKKILSSFFGSGGSFGLKSLESSLSEIQEDLEIKKKGETRYIGKKKSDRQHQKQEEKKIKETNT